jgi:hypothetical protein
MAIEGFVMLDLVPLAGLRDRPYTLASQPTSGSAVYGSFPLFPGMNRLKSQPWLIRYTGKARTC